MFEWLKRQSLHTHTDDRTVFDASPVLRNTQLASYEWGSGEIALSGDAASRTNDFYISNLASYAHGIIPDQSKRDLRCMLALQHECSHYWQDFFTGVGHWDHALRIRIMAGAFARAGRSFDHQLRPALSSQNMYHALDSGTLLLGTPENEEINIISTAIIDDLEISKQDASNLARLFTTRRLLELDAVLSVFFDIKTAKSSDKTFKILNRLDSMWHIGAMPNVYKETIVLCLNEFVRHHGGDKSFVEVALMLTSFMVKLSLAYPDPSHFRDREDDRTSYLPGVKFARLMRAYSHVDSLSRADTAPNAIKELEKALLEEVSYAYPTHDEIYSSWIEYWKNISIDPYPALSRLRLNCAEATLESGAIPRSAGPLFFVNHDLPLNLRRYDGYDQKSYLTGRSLRDRDLETDREAHLRQWKVAQLMLGLNSNLYCPYRNGTMCKGCVPRCKNPFDTLSALPTDECLIREDMKANGILFG